MSSVKFKLILGSIAILAAVTYLAFAGVKSGWVYYMPVDEFMENTERQSQRIRLHGIASEEAFEANPAMLTATFELLGKASQIPVEYSGPIPDQFVPGREVVVEGRLDESGVFQADVLMTKCASKYEGHENAEQTNNGNDR